MKNNLRAGNNYFFKMFVASVFLILSNQILSSAAIAVRIDSPTANSYLKGRVTIVGTAPAGSVLSYNPPHDSGKLIAVVLNPVINANLLQWDTTTVPDGEYDLVLKDSSTNPPTVVSVHVFVDNVDSAVEFKNSEIIAPVGKLLEYKLNANPLDDPNSVNGMVTYAVSGLPTGAAFDSKTNILSWMPEDSQKGTYPIKVTATDNGVQTQKVLLLRTMSIASEAANLLPGFGTGMGQSCQAWAMAKDKIAYCVPTANYNKSNVYLYDVIAKTNTLVASDVEVKDLLLSDNFLVMNLTELGAGGAIRSDIGVYDLASRQLSYVSSATIDYRSLAINKSELIIEKRPFPYTTGVMVTSALYDLAAKTEVNPNLGITAVYPPVIQAAALSDRKVLSLNSNKYVLTGFERATPDQVINIFNDSDKNVVDVSLEDAQMSYMANPQGPNLTTRQVVIGDLDSKKYETLTFALTGRVSLSKNILFSDYFIDSGVMESGLMIYPLKSKQQIHIALEDSFTSKVGIISYASNNNELFWSKYNKLSGHEDFYISKLFFSPKITQIVQSTAGLTIAGEDFGAVQNSSSVVFSNNVACGVTSWSDNAIVCTIPSNAISGLVTVKTAEGSHSLNALFKPPVRSPVRAPLTPVQAAQSAISNYFAVLLSGLDPTAAKAAMVTAIQAVTLPADQQTVQTYYNQSALTAAKTAVDNYFKILAAGQQDPNPAKNIMLVCLQAVMNPPDQQTVATYLNQASVTTAKAAVDNYFKILAAGQQDPNPAKNIMLACLQAVLNPPDQQTVQTYLNQVAVTTAKAAVDNYLNVLVAGQQDPNPAKNVMMACLQAVMNPPDQQTIQAYYDQNVLLAAKATIDNYFQILLAGQQDSNPAKNIMLATMQSVMLPVDQQTIQAYYDQSAMTVAKTAIDNYLKILVAGQQDPNPAKNIMIAAMRAVMLPADQQTIQAYYDQNVLLAAKATIDNYLKILVAGQQDPNPAKNIMIATMQSVMLPADQQTIQAYYDQNVLLAAKATIDNYLKILVAGQQDPNPAKNIMIAAMRAVMLPADQQTIQAYYDQNVLLAAKATIDNYFQILLAGQQDPTPAKNIMSATMQSVMLPVDQQTIQSYYNQVALATGKTAIDNYISILKGGQQDPTPAKNIMMVAMQAVMNPADQQTIQDYYNQQLASIPPMIINEPLSVNPGELLTLHGNHFGDAQNTSEIRLMFPSGWSLGKIVYTAVTLPVEQWSNTEVVGRIPNDAYSGTVEIMTTAGTSNVVPLTVIRHPSIDPVANQTFRVGEPVKIGIHVSNTPELIYGFNEFSVKLSDGRDITTIGAGFTGKSSNPGSFEWTPQSVHANQQFAFIVRVETHDGQVAEQTFALSVVPFPASVLKVLNNGQPVVSSSVTILDENYSPVGQSKLTDAAGLITRDLTVGSKYYFMIDNTFKKIIPGQGYIYSELCTAPCQQTLEITNPPLNFNLTILYKGQPVSMTNPSTGAFSMEQYPTVSLLPVGTDYNFKMYNTSKESLDDGVQFGMVPNVPMRVMVQGNGYQFISAGTFTAPGNLTLELDKMPTNVKVHLTSIGQPFVGKQVLMAYKGNSFDVVEGIMKTDETGTAVFSALKQRKTGQIYQFYLYTLEGGVKNVISDFFTVPEIGQGETTINYNFVQPPQVTQISPTTASVGSVLTIAGANFGTLQMNSSVLFENGAICAVNSWSNQAITCTVPSGAVTGLVKVRTADGDSNGVTVTISTSRPPTRTPTRTPTRIPVQP